MRSRNIKPGFFKSEYVADLDHKTRLLFIALWCYADRDGRFEYRPRKIKAEIFPYEDGDITVNLQLLADHGFIKVYQVGDDTFCQVNNFSKHQSPHHSEKKSIIPYLNQKTVDLPVGNGRNPPDSLIPDSLIPDSSNKNTFPPESLEFQISEHLLSKIKVNNPGAKIPNLQTWAKVVDLMIRIDNRTESEMYDMIDWSQKHEFWHKNILSTEKLRKHFDAMTLQLNERPASSREADQFERNLKSLGDNHETTEDRD